MDGVIDDTGTAMARAAHPPICGPRAGMWRVNSVDEKMGVAPLWEISGTTSTVQGAFVGWICQDPATGGGDVGREKGRVDVAFDTSVVGTEDGAFKGV